MSELYQIIAVGWRRHPHIPRPKVVRKAEQGCGFAAPDSFKRFTEYQNHGIHRIHGRSLNLLLITDHDHDTISEDGVTIKVVTAREWLLGLY